MACSANLDPKLKANASRAPSMTVSYTMGHPLYTYGCTRPPCEMYWIKYIYFRQEPLSLENMRSFWFRQIVKIAVLRQPSYMHSHWVSSQLKVK